MIGSIRRAQLRGGLDQWNIPLKQLQAGDVPVRRTASLASARVAAMVAEVVEISDGKSVCRVVVFV
jgi:hypothetical protein